RSRSRQLKHPLTIGAAAAWDAGVPLCVVVVGQLLALADRAGGANPDHAILDVRVAIRLARVVDVPRDVAPDGRVDDPTVFQLEAPECAALEIMLFARPALRRRDLFAAVVDDPCVLANGLPRKHAPSVDPRLPPLDRWRIRQVTVGHLVGLGLSSFRTGRRP